MNLALEAKNLYSENYKMVMKLKKTQRSGKISCVHGSDKLVLLKSPYNQKLWYPSQTPMTLFIKLGKIKS